MFVAQSRAWQCRQAPSRTWLANALRPAPTQTVQCFLETRGHARESLREQANFIVSPNLRDLPPLTLCDRLSRLCQGGQRPQRASDHGQPEQQEDGDDGCADANRE